jgi:hypothetical protein
MELSEPYRAATSFFEISGRALVAGERDPFVLAGMARTAMRKRVPELRQANDPAADFVDLGPDYDDQRRGVQRAVRCHIRQLQALGYQVTLQPTA